MVTQPEATGAQIAQNIGILARDQAAKAEDALIDAIRATAAKELDVSPDQLPTRLVNSFSRGSTQVGKDQAIREIRLILSGSTTELQDPKAVFQLIGNQVSEKRRLAHKLRSQASSIRSVLRVLEPLRLGNVSQNTSDWLENQRARLNNQSINSIQDLEHWAIQVVDFFEEFNRAEIEADRALLRKNTVSTSAVRNYSAIFRSFVNKNLRTIFEMDNLIISSGPIWLQPMKVSPEPEVRSGEVTIELIGNADSAIQMKKTWINSPAAKREFRSWIEAAKIVFGENSRIDQMTISKNTAQGPEVIKLEQIQVSKVAELLEKIL